jgi:hypothetical protein
VLPLADAFMILMLSRPGSGSLRSTWVTPATLLLGAGLALAGAPVLVVLLAAAARGSAFTAVAGFVVFVIVAGSLSVAVVGLLQRR